MSEEAEAIINKYYWFLRQNPRVSKDRKSVRMLESLIRLCEAHARLYMKSQASVFDAVSVIVLMEHTLMSCLFGAESTPGVLFRDKQDYEQVRDNVLYRLELDPFKLQGRPAETGKRSRTPSPIRRIEGSYCVGMNST